MYGWRGRLGVIMPRNNSVLEPEMYTGLPAGVSLHGARLVSRGKTTPERIFSMTDNVPHAIEELETRVGVFCYACMTTSLLKPVGWHQAFAERTGGRPFWPAGESMVHALNHLGAGRVGVFSPYPDEIAGLVPGWFRPFGIEVVHSANIPFTPDQVVSRRTEDLYPLIHSEFSGRTLDALVILATDLATFTVVDSFEADFGVPVVSSNLALLFAMLGSIGVREAPVPGRLFRTLGAAAGGSGHV